MAWYHIEFEDGSNPYICFNEEEFKRWQKNWDLRPKYSEEYQSQYTTQFFIAKKKEEKS